MQDYKCFDFYLKSFTSYNFSNSPVPVSLFFIYWLYKYLSEMAKNIIPVALILWWFHQVFSLINKLLQEYLTVHKYKIVYNILFILKCEKIFLNHQTSNKAF